MKISLLAFLCMSIVSCSKASQAPDNTPPKDTVLPIAPIEEVKNKPVAVKTTFNQIDRRGFLENFELDSATFFKETLVKASPSEVRGKIDILFVVDNSGSMREEQKNLSTKVQPLLSEIEEQDWQINVITTDDPCPTTDALPITAETENLLSEFEDSIDVGTWGSGKEKAIEMAYNHIRGTHEDEECHAASWMRQGAGLSVIILSDEDEDSSTTIGPGKFIRSIEQYGFESGFNARVFGIISKPDEPCPSAQQPAKIYSDLILRTAGFSGDICASDYTEILEKISVALSDLVLSEMKLQHVPEPSSIVVQLNGAPFPTEYWRNAGNQISFAYSFQPGDKVEVEYLTEYQRTFLLKSEPNSESIAVKVDGDLLDRQNFELIEERSLEEKKFILYIPSLPPSSAKLNVEYKVNEELIDEFDFSVYTNGEIDCQKDGKKLSFTYSKISQTIRFSPPLKDGEKANCEFWPDI